MAGCKRILFSDLGSTTAAFVDLPERGCGRAALTRPSRVTSRRHVGLGLRAIPPNSLGSMRSLEKRTLVTCDEIRDLDELVDREALVSG